MNKKVILSTAYLAPIQYYTKLIKYDEIYVEAQENFIKQTYRNRCVIYAANGLINLSIPVKKIAPKTKTKDLLIDYDTKWQKLHWKSIQSAYKSSPFFEFYEDDIVSFYKSKYKYLLDFNLEIQNQIMEILEVDVKVKRTEDFQHELPGDYDDFRDLIHPKKDNLDPDFVIKKYTQVFIEKYGFKSNLSIIDLLFNEGPNSLVYLK